MPAKSTSFANSILKLILNGTAIANIADNAAASPLTNVYIALHSASPGVAGDQTTNEVAYTSYARVAVPRTTGGWAAATAAISAAVAAVTFPQCTGGTVTATHWSVGTAASGAGVLLYFGPLAASIAISNSVIPTMTTASITEA